MQVLISVGQTEEGVAHDIWRRNLYLTEHSRLYGLFRQTHKQTGVKVQPPALFFKRNDLPTADNKVAGPDALRLTGLFKEGT